LHEVVGEKVEHGLKTKPSGDGDNLRR
jgi:hypothetical protein